MFPPLQNQSGIRIGHVSISVDTNAPILAMLQALEERYARLGEYNNYNVNDKEIEILAIDCKATTKQILNLMESDFRYNSLIIKVLESLELIYDKYLEVGNKIDLVIKISIDYADLVIQFMNKMCRYTLNEEMVCTILSYEWALKNGVLSTSPLYPVSFGGMTDEQTYIFSPSEVEKFFDNHRVQAVNKILRIDRQNSTHFYSDDTKKLFKIYRKMTGMGNNNASLLEGII